MTRTRRWMASAAAVLVLLLAGLALLARLLLPSDEQIAAEVGARFEQATGIGLRVGAAHWALRPVPIVVLSELSTAQAPPVTVRRIVVRPQLAALWQRRIAIDVVEIEGAVLPRASVRALRENFRPEALAGGSGAQRPWSMAETPLERLRLRDVVWIGRRGIGLAYDADVVFDPAWRPREAELSRPGVSPATKLRIEREGGEDRWRTRIDAGGGAWTGSAALQTLANDRLRLSAELELKDVDIEGLVGAFGRKAVVEGRADGRTELRSEADNVAGLVRGLRTRTRFDLRPATLKGFDLARAVRTAGAEREGRTVLDALGGTLETESTEGGIVLRYSGLEARSGVLTASGRLTVRERRLQGEAAVDLVDGMVGVPFKVGGTLDDPELSLTGGALAGAAVGTAVLPGVGTALGARIGQQVEKLFGGGEDEKKKKKP